MKDHWKRTTDDFAQEMKAAMDSNSDLRFTQMLLDFLQLPYRALTPIIETKTKRVDGRNLNHPDPAGTEAGGNRIHRKVVSLVRQERVGKAMQQLMSNGCAGNTMDVYKQMVDMHPKRKKPLKKHNPTVKQVHVSKKQAKNYLYELAATDQSSAGVFGWAAGHLLPMRGSKELGMRTTFINQTARLTAGLSNAQVPPICGYILTCGGIFALHKLNQEEQREREEDGSKAKLRPVNIGCSILKWAFKLVLKSPQARAAIARLAPLQMGLGSARGAEIVAHLFMALYEQGYIVLTTDFTNGFNAFLRQAILDAVQKRCPALTAMFNTFYALDSMCFFFVDGKIKII